MVNVKDLKDKVVNGGGVFTFLRSSVASQLASWTDLGLRFILFRFVLMGMNEFYRSNLSVAIGSVVGGIINCTLNYKYTFHASGQSVKAVGVKYFLVWTGSLLLNMYGTTFATLLVGRWTWLHTLGFTTDGIFAAATLLVSLIVSLAWNFVLQRNFVYRQSKFDPAAIKFVNFFLPRHRRTEPQ